MREGYETAATPVEPSYDYYFPPAILPDDLGPVVIPRQWIFLREELARLAGYAWLPCPLCGFDFAGFEAGHQSVPDPQGLAEPMLCCRWCDEQVVRKADVFPMSGGGMSCG